MANEETMFPERAVEKEGDEEREREREREGRGNPGSLLSTATDGPCVLTCVQRLRGLTSAAGYHGIQAGPLCDADLGQVLSAGWVDAHGLQQVRICCSTPETQNQWEVIHTGLTCILS